MSDHEPRRVMTGRAEGASNGSAGRQAGGVPTDPKSRLWGRRDFVTALGWTAVGGSLLTSVVAFFRLLFRRAPVEPPSVFCAGRPADFAEGSTTDRFMPDWRVYLVRERGAIFALHGRCTHLGCTPRWYAAQSKFKCPCHGSGFHRDGVNFEGPAPRPLERARIWVDRDDRLWVDVAVRFDHTQWHLPGTQVSVETRA